jgi:polar amino acid transport system substrate-binding protein
MIRSRHAWVIGILVAVVMAATGCGKSGRLVNQTPDTLDTILPGTLKVAIQPYAPYTSLEGDKLVGLDSDILIEIANALTRSMSEFSTHY